MLNWWRNFGKKGKNGELLAVVDGDLSPLSKAPDPAFSSLAMGNGVMIKPESNQILAPTNGVITMLFPTKHAFGITTVDGIEILIHLGVDTIQLKGEGFDFKKRKGDKIKNGEMILHMDHDKIEQKGYDSTVMMIITDSNNHEITYLETGKVEAGKTIVGSFTVSKSFD